jgi:predicted nucleic acid-binding protein
VTPRHVVVDANVFLSFLVERNKKQRAAAKALLLSADDGEIVAIVTQFVIFEITYVLQNSYGIAIGQVATLVREMMALPGVVVTDDCPWKKIFEYWPDRLPSMADAAVVAVAVTNRYDAVATFDQKIVKGMKGMGVESYW